MSIQKLAAEIRAQLTPALALEIATVTAEEGENRAVAYHRIAPHGDLLGWTSTRKPGNELLAAQQALHFASMALALQLQQRQAALLTDPDTTSTIYPTS